MFGVWCLLFVLFVVYVVCCLLFVVVVVVVALVVVLVVVVVVVVVALVVVLVVAHGVLHDPVEFFVFWTFIPAFMHHGSGAGARVGGWGGMISTPAQRSTAADQPALLPDYKITWFRGGGGWGGA